VSHPQAWAFLKPVNAEEVKDYYDVITDPMGMHPYMLCNVLG
jgi:hypothetical protein